MAIAVLIVAVVTRTYKRLPSYFDAALSASAISLIAYRMGNFFHQSHPGTKTDFFLGFDFKGVTRHDPTFYELISLTILSIMIW